MITVGVAALLGLTMAGGFGGTSELSIWWGVLVMPYLIGLSMSIWWWGDSPRWILWLGLGVGVWYLAILVMTLKRSVDRSSLAGIVVDAIGAFTVSGCIFRLRKRSILSRD